MRPNRADLRWQTQPLGVAGKENTHSCFVRQDGGSKDIGRGYLGEAFKDALGVLECARPVIRLPGHASHFDERCYRIGK